MIRIVAFLFAVVAAMGMGVAASDDDHQAPMRTIPVPAPLAMVEQARHGCGAVLARPGGSGVWRCVLSDEFDGSRLDLTRWNVVTTAESGFSSGIPPAYACYVYDPRTVSVAGGFLHLSVVKVDDVVQCGGPAAQPTEYLGGAVSTKYRLAQTYGRYEIRARFATDEQTGLQSSLILTPDHPEYGERSGEMDIAEFFTKWPHRVFPYVRYDHEGDDPTATSEACRVADPGQFHRYTLEWTPQRIETAVDGHSCVSTTWDKGTELKHPAPFDRPFVLSMFEALGVSKAAFDVEDAPRLPATMQVDYVHVWGKRDT
ncbi:MAG TPA: glycoside hydrolase family 16 protein [Aeromicrobium sp.]|nr:glycoside hydrolase family 16 protein [Aeromicrobium sp.]